MHQQSSSSRSGRTLAWLLAILAMVMIAAVLLAIRRFNRDVARDMEETAIESKNAETPLVPMTVSDANDNRDAEGYLTLAGFVSEMTTQEKAGGKAIVLATVTPDEKTGLPHDVSYRFFLSDKDTAGSADIKGGESVTIHFAGSPSETSYIVAKKVERMR